MYLRFTDKQLDEMLKKVTHAGTSPETWIKKVDKTISSSKPGSNTKALKELLKEGREIDAPKDSLDTLKDYIDAVDQWMSDAERLLSFKSDSSRSNKRRDQRAKDLIDKASLIGFDVPYVDELKAYSEKLGAFDSRLTEQVLASEDTSVKMELYNEGLQLRADSEKFSELRALIESCSWEEQAEYAMKSTYSPRTFRKLIKDAEDYGITKEEEPLLDQLITMDNFGKDVLQRIDNICKGKEKIGLDEEENILNIGQHPKNPELSIRVDPQQILRLKNNLTRSKNTLGEIEDMLLNHCRRPSVIQRPSLTDAQRLMALCRELSFKSELIPQLGNEISRMGSWNELVRSTFMSGRQKSLETVLRETLSNVQRITTSEDKPATWCICRRAESGLMIACEICHEWYHSSCLKVPRNVVRSSSSYVCPICHLSDGNAKITHLSRQPRLEEITDLIVGAEPLKFRPKDYKIIFEIHTLMVEYRNRVQTFCRSRTQLGLEDLGKIKYYLRTLLGLEVYLQDEAEFLRTKIQSLMPIAPPPASKTMISTNLENSSVHTKIENGTTHDRKLITTVRPLSSNHHQNTSQSINCTCHEDSKQECPTCSTESTGSSKLLEILFIAAY
jgi:histone demethylase JARID1